MREGEKNGRAKLTWAMVKRLRRIYKKGEPFKKNPVSILNLAIDHDVSTGTMWDAITGRTWRR